MSIFSIRFINKLNHKTCYIAAFLALTGCTPPVSVKQLSLTEAYQDRTHTALNGTILSNTTRIVLERQNLLGIWQAHPSAAIDILRKSTQDQFFTPDLNDQLFALAELSYLRGKKHKSRTDFMAAAMYAYAYLNPADKTMEHPDPYDPHFRQACDIYMLSLTEALGSPANVNAQHWVLPFGDLDLSADPSEHIWHGYELTDFRPTARLTVKGVKNIYSHMGLGEPLAAIPHVDGRAPSSFTITDKLRIPVSLFMEIPDPRRQVLSDHISGHLTLTALDDQGHILTANKTPIPLQYDQTASRALSLSNAVDWSSEYKGFLDGRFFDNGRKPQLIAIEPHRYGCIPVVLVHGTASSPGRWADMVNDLLEDPQIRAHFEFWFFSYATGNPIPYSAFQLREALEAAIQNNGGTQADPALGHMVLIGHSQGGLLAKMQVIDPKDKLWNGLTHHPFNSLHLTPKAHSFLQETLFPKPLPEVQQVVFISTPQHGSYLAALSLAHLVGRMVTFPVSLTEVMQQVVAGESGSIRVNMSPWRMGSVYGMTPHSAFIRSLASIPIVPEVRTHSIIPVLGDGPLATADDGVVKYRSAHISYADSELVVRHSGHSTQSNPITIAEVRRILLEHLAHLTPGVPETGDMNKQNITRIGGEYQPTTPPVHP
ncbi:esterase/lipase family protein [Acetobacter pasteurianus]|uniref:esterase/lipase family protein n=1 Tax=Acetobacter pasteurianus TaxID=438 RepID=UPI001362F35D|nr:alpha/beta hydrolase [Acetobacter pasteurianus]QHM91735.1 alpha/beta hydrolase [Acetobacter pasteurianus]